MQGRCLCGFVASGCAVRRHQVECLKFAAAFRAGHVLGTAEQEYERWTAEGRPAERAAAHAESVTATDTRRAAMADRFRTVDILED